MITFSFIKAQRIELEIFSPSKAGETEKRHYKLERALLNEKAQTDIERHKIPIRLGDLDIGKAFDQFQEIFDLVELTLHWCRIVLVEERYLENMFFYCVRMIEGLYRTLNIATEVDKEAIKLVNEISNVLARDELKNAPLIKFLSSRVLNVFPALLSQASLRILRSNIERLVLSIFWTRGR